MRRSAWESQPYDEELTGLEDLDWAKRAMERGKGISYVANRAGRPRARGDLGGSW